MAPHVHVGVVEFLTVACYVLIFNFLWRMLTARLMEKYPNLAGAMAAVNS
jgi:hypothetical protein